LMYQSQNRLAKKLSFGVSIVSKDLDRVRKGGVLYSP